MNEQLTQDDIQPKKFVTTKEFADPNDQTKKYKEGDDVSHLSYGVLLDLKEGGFVRDLFNQ